MKQSCSRALAALILGGAIAIGGCRDGSEPLVPGSLQVLAGDGQTAAAGNPVPLAPSVRLVSTTGKPISGAQVTFAAGTDGVVTPAQQVTSAQGIAALTSWTLPTRTGSHQLTVSSAGVAPVVLTATATAGAPARLTRLSADPQDATVATEVAEPPIVVVTDAHANPIAGVAVAFAAGSNGAVQVSSTTSDANGIARAERWTLGPLAGQQFLMATLPGVPTYPGLAFIANGIAGPALRLGVTTQPATTRAAGEPLATQPVVDIQDEHGNRVFGASAPVTASLVPGSTQTLSGGATVSPVNGRATFADLAIDGAGDVQLRFTAAGLTDATSAAFNVPVITQCPGIIVRLENFQVGQSARYLANGVNTPACFDFDVASNAGQQYLVQIENISINGNSDTGVFPGQAIAQPGFPVAVTTSVLPSGAAVPVQRVTNEPAGAVHSWDFGSGLIYEIEPRDPIAPPASIKPRLGIETSVLAAAAVGDTISVMMEGIPRLGIPTGTQRAVVRYVGDDLIFAEDVRLATLPRQGGGTNTPLTMTDMQAIAADYAQYAKVQSDAFFGGRHNGFTEANGGKIIAIHSLMYDNNVWGYTYPNSNYFVWDFWVGTDGSVRGPNQQIARNANNLFMHEIAHMRHFGMNERAAKPRGNRWLIEGFARATERWPIAMRLLGTADFSRTGNIVLPGYATSSLNTLEDVPAYTQASVSIYGGYAASSYVFDYFADQVARTTTSHWRIALGEFLVNAASESDLNLIINRYLPGVDFGTLLTRARLALYLDDFANGLPDWTQFHQFQLRASRQTQNPQLDPRNLWSRITPGMPFSEARDLARGGAFGYIIDGAAATANARVLFDVPIASYAALSITRIR